MYGLPQRVRAWAASSLRSARSAYARLEVAASAHRLSDVKCIRPFKRELAAFGCGQCMPCRINKHRVWTTRLLLEASEQPGFFVTLTYSDEHLPKEGLSKAHCQRYLRDLRRIAHPVTVRYFCVGEYGERFGRPHYHLALFGCLVPSQIVAAWGRGIVDVRLLAKESASYLCGYLQKGSTKSLDVAAGRTPEFRLMSRKPGIGALAMAKIAAVLRPHRDSDDGVLAAVRLDGQLRPLGRYLKDRLRAVLSGGDPDVVARMKLQENLDRNALLPVAPGDVAEFKRLQELDIEKAKRAAIRAEAVIKSQRERKRL